MIIDMNEIISIYNDSVNNNLKMIENIIRSDIGLGDPHLMELFKETLQTSKNELVKKWRTGKKYLRTLAAVKAFPDYPVDSLKISISIDAIINILDDLLDEKLEKRAKNYYIVEIIRTLANYHYQNNDEIIRLCIGNYFNKCMTIAILEKHFYDLVRNENREDELLKYLTYVYDIRSLDIDVFIEIPLLESNIFHVKGDVLKAARSYRALELIKKDFLDVEHDGDSGIDTLFTILWDREGALLASVSSLTDQYLERIRNITGSEDSNEIVKNFVVMSEVEAVEIGKYVRKSRLLKV